MKQTNSLSEIICKTKITNHGSLQLLENLKHYLLEKTLHTTNSAYNSCNFIVSIIYILRNDPKKNLQI